MGIANGGEWGGAAAAAAAGGKGCDSCKAAAAAVFCRVDTAFLCLSCDAKIHCANRLASRHERVWMCEVCEQAPAAVTCKADAAALCVSCDADIHSANPLAQRHDRVPIEPFFDSTDSLVRSSAADAAAAALNFFSSSAGTGACTNNNHDDDDYSPSDGACHPHHDNDLVVETSPWIISNAKLNLDAPDLKSSGEIFFSEMDSFLDFDYSNNPIHGTDSVVPVKIKPISPSPIINHPENCFDIDFCRSKLSSFTNYASHCLSHSVSSSSLDVGVVPDGNSINEISYTFGRSLSKTGAGGDPIPRVPASSTSTSTTTTSQATQLCGLDREARVLRYREKRKNRKFEKTIRYASRKAYAETRPRIKGRFAKRTEIEIDADVDADQIYGGGSAFFAPVADSQYGVVPTF